MHTEAKFNSDTHRGWAHIKPSYYSVPPDPNFEFAACIPNFIIWLFTVEGHSEKQFHEMHQYVYVSIW